ncbi:hypothetical protein H8356DRAFT_1351695 [Neocallimastix lanati (nom. inval.)]|nr:hypothetical protein H8356DRAFT_1351695 [Neocallimastix sp. JGI-2020a]
MVTNLLVMCQNYFMKFKVRFTYLGQVYCKDILFRKRLEEKPKQASFNILLILIILIVLCLKFKYLDKWKDLNCIISYLVNNNPKSRKYTWTKESRTLKRKLEKRSTEFYDKNRFKEISDIIKLYYEYLEFHMIKCVLIFIPDLKLIDCSFFNHIHCKINDKFLFLYNAFNRGDLTNDIVNSNNRNRNNSYNNNIYNNISNIIISNVSNSIENNVYVNSSLCEKVFNFFLGERSINNSAYSNTPILVVTAALFQLIIPIAIGQQFKSNRTIITKSVNAEEIIRQASKASATN